MQKYRKKPVVIEAWELTSDSCRDIQMWIAGDGTGPKLSVNGSMYPSNAQWTDHDNLDDKEVISLEIATLEGKITASPGDYIIKGVQGEFYPCKPDVFKATYEEV